MELYFLAAIYMGLVLFAVRRNQNRLAVAFLLAPLTPALILGATADELFWIVVFIPFSYFCSLAGAPVYFGLRRLGWLEPWHFVMAGAALGFAVSLVTGFGQANTKGDVLDLRMALIFAGCGAATAFVFWLIAYARPRPDSS